jgi:hypothetical protein
MRNKPSGNNSGRLHRELVFDKNIGGGYRLPVSGKVAKKMASMPFFQLGVFTL